MWGMGDPLAGHTDSGFTSDHSICHVYCGESTRYGCDTSNCFWSWDNRVVDGDSHAYTVNGGLDEFAPKRHAKPVFDQHPARPAYLVDDILCRGEPDHAGSLLYDPGSLGQAQRQASGAAVVSDASSSAFCRPRVQSLLLSRPSTYQPHRQRNMVDRGPGR